MAYMNPCDKNINTFNLKNLKVTSFKSIHEFNDYIDNTPLNAIFRWEKISSVGGDKYFTGTSNYQEAIDLLKNGWSDMSKKLEQKLKIAAKEIAPKKVNRMAYDVAGFQASVPRYLQGIPTNMVNKKSVTQKQKVITIVKNIGYNCNITTEEIIEQSIKAFMIVKAIEEKGIRVNLEICWSSEKNGERFLYKVRLKNASERLNISKMAFPMVNPSMLRRVMFRMLEVDPNITQQGWKIGYGRSLTEASQIQPMLGPNEYCLPSFIRDIDQVIESLSK
jgi:hypothetical protein